MHRYMAAFKPPITDDLTKDSQTKQELEDNRKKSPCCTPAVSPSLSRKSSHRGWDIVRHSTLGQLQGHVNLAVEEEEEVYHV